MVYALIQRVRADRTRPRNPIVVFPEAKLEDIVAEASWRIRSLSEWWGTSTTEVPYRSEMSIVEFLGPPFARAEIDQPFVLRGISDEPFVVILDSSDLSKAASWSRVGEFELSDISRGSFDALFRLNAMRIAEEKRGRPLHSSLLVRRRPVRAYRRSK